MANGGPPLPHECTLSVTPWTFTVTVHDLLRMRVYTTGCSIFQNPYETIMMVKNDCLLQAVQVVIEGRVST